MWASNEIEFTDTISLDNSVVPSISGPKRPQDKVLLTEAAKVLIRRLRKILKEKTFRSKSR